MTKFRKLLLTFVRWRERRAWAACQRWQRIAWRLHGYRVEKWAKELVEQTEREMREMIERAPAPSGLRDGYAGTFDEPPPGWTEGRDAEGRPVAVREGPNKGGLNSPVSQVTERPAAPPPSEPPKEDGYFLRPSWRDEGALSPQGPMIDNIRKAGGA